MIRPAAPARPGATRWPTCPVAALLEPDSHDHRGEQDHLKITAVGGSDQGAVVSGQLAGRATAAWVSATGRSWRRVAGLGGSAQALAGVTVTAGETVVAAGATAHTADGQQPDLVLSGRQASAVNFAAIRGAAGPALRVSGIAVAGRTHVAVGSANGCTRPSGRPCGAGRWQRISSAALTRPGLSILSSVVHGKPGMAGGRRGHHAARPAIPSSSPRPGGPSSRLPTASPPSAARGSRSARRPSAGPGT